MDNKRIKKILRLPISLVPKGVVAALWAGAKADKNVLIKTKCLVVCKCVRLKNNNFFNIFLSIGEKMTSPTTVYRGSFFIKEYLCEYLCDGRIKCQIKA